jgi:hypothetical protein
MAKLNRERKLVEKRHAKQIRKDARRQAAADGIPSHELRERDDADVDELAVEEP